MLLLSVLLAFCGLFQAMASPIDREAFLIQQLADAACEQDLVMLVIAPVAAPLDRAQLRELLLPVTQYMGFDPAQLADLTDGEVTLGGNRWQIFPAIAGYRHAGMPRQPS